MTDTDLYAIQTGRRITVLLQYPRQSHSFGVQLEDTYKLGREQRYHID
jgi:hypothetical protein